MIYRIAFAKRFQSDGTESVIDPSSELDTYLPDGVVAEKEMVERFEPAAQHSQEVLDEDDAFLGLATAEVWEYDVIDERAQEFEDAIRNSQTVMEFEVVDNTPTTADEVTGVVLGDGDTRAPDRFTSGEVVTRGGSGVRGVDDGPGGQITGDPSAGGMGPGRPYLSLDEAEGAVNSDTGIDDLNIVSVEDPRLGLTDYGDVGPDDWAANTGPTRTPEEALPTSSLPEKSSTPAPGKKK
ncbi:MAG: hypothetical protein ACJ73N_06200 [Bryobacteraceae bacterium]